MALTSILLTVAYVIHLTLGAPGAVVDSDEWGMEFRNTRSRSRSHGSDSRSGHSIISGQRYYGGVIGPPIGTGGRARTELSHTRAGRRTHHSGGMRRNYIRSPLYKGETRGAYRRDSLSSSSAGLPDTASSDRFRATNALHSFVSSRLSSGGHGRRSRRLGGDRRGPATRRGSGHDRGTPPTGDYFGGEGGLNGLPTLGGAGIGREYADGGVSKGVGNGYGIGSRRAYEARIRSGRRGISAIEQERRGIPIGLAAQRASVTSGHMGIVGSGSEARIRSGRRGISPIEQERRGIPIGLAAQRASLTSGHMGIVGSGSEARIRSGRRDISARIFRRPFRRVGRFGGRMEPYSGNMDFRHV